MVSENPNSSENESGIDRGAKLVTDLYERARSYFEEQKYFKYVISIFASSGFLAILSQNAAMLLYTISHGLPFFEVAKDFQDYATEFTAISVFFTLVLAAYIVILAGIRAMDPKQLPAHLASKINPETAWKYDAERWMLAFAPGLIVSFLLLVLMSYDESRKLIVWASISAPFFIAILSLCVILYRKKINIYKESTGRITGEERRQLKEIIRIECISEKNLGYLSLTNLLSFVLISFLLSIANKIASTHQLLTDRLELPWISVDGAFVGTITLLLFFGITTLLTRASAKTFSIGLFAVLMFLIFLWPRADILVERYLSALGTGGGRQVILTTDAKTHELWPELFYSGADEMKFNSKLRTKPVKLELLGAERVYLRPIDGEASSKNRKPFLIILERRYVRDIAFVD